MLGASTACAQYAQQSDSTAFANSDSTARSAAYSSANVSVEPADSKSAIKTQEGVSKDQLAMLEILRDRVVRKPDHSDSWRMLGRLEQQCGDPAAAFEAVRQSLILQPGNAAAHFDFFRLLKSAGDDAQANYHARQVLLIAPQSKYAQQLIDIGFEPLSLDESATPIAAVDNQNASRPGESPIDYSGTQPVGYEVQTLDGKDDFDLAKNRLVSDSLPKRKRLRMFVEAGGMYNSNVTLTPISRELVEAEAASFQGLLTPDVEWIAIDREVFRAGTIGRGYFAVNEDEFTEFNLSSFQPGLFAEKDFTFADNELTARIDYVYALDLLAGSRFGDRHSITTSLINIRPDLDVIYAFLTTSMSDFANDGTNPDVESLDGTSVSAGINRFFSNWLAESSDMVDGRGDRTC